MGADLCLACIPAAKITSEREARLHDIIDELKDNEIDHERFEWIGLGSSSEIRESLHKHVEQISDVESCRDTVTFQIDDMPYPMTFSGGMSWGDSPTETYDLLCVISECVRLWDQLKEWAKQDSTEDS